MVVFCCAGNEKQAFLGEEVFENQRRWRQKTYSFSAISTLDGGRTSHLGTKKTEEEREMRWEGKHFVRKVDGECMES
jgi:hypothetical protein